jgi:hypothetical protein
MLKWPIARRFIIVDEGLPYSNQRKILANDGFDHQAMIILFEFTLHPDSTTIWANNRFDLIRITPPSL